MEFLTNNIGLLAGGGSSAIALWVLKKIPNDKIYGIVRAACYTAGTVVTLGMSKFSITKKFWKGAIEPYFVDLINNTVGAAVSGFIAGLKSDD